MAIYPHRPSHWFCFSGVGLADDNATIHVALADKGTSHCPGSDVQDATSAIEI
jgi:hypothetical protein